jgi:hypothetical protein
LIDGDFHPGAIAPVDASSRATLERVPSIVENEPPTNTVPALGPGMIVATLPLTVGLNRDAIAPVPAVNPNKCGLVCAAELPCGVTEVKDPPTNTVDPS